MCSLYIKNELGVHCHRFIAQTSGVRREAKSWAGVQGGAAEMVAEYCRRCWADMGRGPLSNNFVWATEVSHCHKIPDSSYFPAGYWAERTLVFLWVISDGNYRCLGLLWEKLASLTHRGWVTVLLRPSKAVNQRLLYCRNTLFQGKNKTSSSELSARVLRGPYVP